jgi:hypothetical protein
VRSGGGTWGGRVGMAEFIFYPELWGGGGHMGSFSQIPTKSAASSACFMNDCRNLKPRE